MSYTNQLLRTKQTNLASLKQPQIAEYGQQLAKKRLQKTNKVRKKTSD